MQGVKNPKLNRGLKRKLRRERRADVKVAERTNTGLFRDPRRKRKRDEQMERRFEGPQKEGKKKNRFFFEGTRTPVVEERHRGAGDAPGRKGKKKKKKFLTAGTGEESGMERGKQNCKCNPNRNKKTGKAGLFTGRQKGSGQSLPST